MAWKCFCGITNDGNFCGNCGRRSTDHGTPVLLPSQQIHASEHLIPCKVCDRGTLARKKQHRLAGPAVLIGYFLLVPSVIGMCLALMAEMFLLFASTNTQSREGAGIIALLGTGFTGFAFVVSLIGGLLGWLLVMKKHVLQCSTCGATIAASPIKKQITPLGMVLVGLLTVLCLFFIFGGKGNAPEQQTPTPSPVANISPQANNPPPHPQPQSAAYQPLLQSQPNEQTNPVLQRVPDEPSVAENQTSQPVVTAQPPASTSSPPVETSSPRFGVVCNGAVNVPQNGTMVFKDLPSDRLHFTFDHDAWQPTIQPQPDGRKTLVMRSLKPGIQTYCHVRWEIVP